MTNEVKHTNIEKVIHAVARNYSTLSYLPQLSKMLNSIFPIEDFTNMQKYELHSLLNKTIIENYNGEEILKYKLFETQYKKTNIVGAFEIRVNNSRLDFLTINGSTTSYEIKSELDTLSKLEKQISDYLLAFEYNYLVIDKKHLDKAKEMIPENFGLWCYANGKYKKLRKATLNDQLDPETQLSLLTKKERAVCFNLSEGSINTILKHHTPSEINEAFKLVLKLRYRSRWDFIVSKRNSIFPIDLQFFFNTNIEPNHIYY